MKKVSELKPGKETIASKKALKDARARAIENNPCAMCKALNLPVCKGHKNAGGGRVEGSGNGLASSSASEEGLFEETNERAETSLQLRPPFRIIYDSERLHDLFQMKLRPGHGIFAIQARRKLLLENAQAIQEFLRLLKLEFDQFKQALEKKGVPVENFTAAKYTHALVLHIPQHKYYDAFMEHLVGHNLLAKEFMKSLTPVRNPGLMLTPMSMTTQLAPKMRPYKLKEDEVLEEQLAAQHKLRFNLTPFH